MITVLLVVAVWRVTRLLVVDEFPPTRAVREWVIRTFAHVDQQGQLGRRPGRFGAGGISFAVAYLWTCMWCMSVWVGGVVVFATTVWVSVPAPWLLVAAGSGVSGVMSWIENEHDQRWAARDAAARKGGQ